jgi:hypothetical protein
MPVEGEVARGTIGSAIAGVVPDAGWFPARRRRGLGRRAAVALLTGVPVADPPLHVVPSDLGITAAATGAGTDRSCLRHAFVVAAELPIGRLGADTSETHHPARPIDTSARCGGMNVPSSARPRRRAGIRRRMPTSVIRVRDRRRENDIVAITSAQRESSDHP